MFVKNRFCHFRTFPWLLKNMQNQNKFVGNSQSFAPPPPTSSTEFPPPYMLCNIHHFGITKRKVMTSKLRVTASKLQVTASKLLRQLNAWASRRTARPQRNTTQRAHCVVIPLWPGTAEINTCVVHAWQ